MSESHCSVHTYPEYNSLFIDLFTCGETCSWEGFDKIMTQFLQPKKSSKNVIIRGQTNIIQHTNNDFDFDRELELEV